MIKTTTGPTLLDNPFNKHTNGNTIKKKSQLL